MLSHRETETAFGAALVGTGVPPGVTARGDVERRFGVYRNTVVHSLTEALAERFPAVRRIVGARFFKAATGLFARSNLPRTPLLQDYGSEFPSFLAGFLPAFGLPYLPDVARLELFRGRAYHAADAAPLSPAAFALTAAASPERLKLTLHPSLHLLSSAYPAISIWQANQPNARPVRIEPGAEAALIFREGAAVTVQSLAPTNLRVLSSIAVGTPLGKIWAETTPDEVTAILSLLLRHGLVVGATVSES